jgi:uncharacterized protein (DUF2336 family)
MVSRVTKPFRTLESGNPETRKDDILRAAITAFVGLTQPGKRDANQIEDLALSILPFTSESTRRFVAAALSDKHCVPPRLARRLCEEPADVCAPLLLRSPVLSALDLVSIIGAKGISHARVIANRPFLPNPVIEALALIDDTPTQQRAAEGRAATPEDPLTNLANVKPISADAARDLLRQMMGKTDDAATIPVNEVSGHSVPLFLPREAATKLIGLALREQEGLFVTALADMSGLPYPRALKLLRRPSASELMVLLKSFEIDGPTAFLICSVFYPQITSSRQDTRLFLDMHDALDVDDAASMVRGWKAEEIQFAVRRLGVNTDAAEYRDLNREAS